MGYGELGSAIAESASQHANIHLHPPVAHHLVVEYASSADVGLCFIENVSLSDYLCLPNKLFEYAFANLAVLASDFPEIRRTVEQYALGSVCQPDRGAIQDAVAAFIASPSAQRPANDLFALSWDHQAQKLVSLYETLLPQLRHSAQIH
jgi:glycosyltransferase involved in cell wall biosynthesis